MKAIFLDHLSKTFPGGTRAVDGLSIQLDPGEILGVLGPNGAGKTTTVKLLTGMLTPSSGSCAVLGHDPARQPEQVHAISGVVTEHAQMYDTLTGLENLAFFGALFGLPPAESQTRGLALLELLDLAGAAGQKLGTYSTGMRQRLSLARALMHRPSVLFLDEPTSGLDPQSAQAVHSLLRRLAREEGITIFLCTHQLRYAQEICTCYGLMDHGRLFAQGTLDQLQAQWGGGITVTIQAGGPSLPFPQTAPGRYEIPIASMEEIPALVRRVVDAGGAITQVTPCAPTLEELYFHLITQQEEVAS